MWPPHSTFHTQHSIKNMIKTNKSYAKRLKVTRTGKILSRKPGQNHFNAKERTRASLSKRRMSVITHMKNKAKSRFLVNL